MLTYIVRRLLYSIPVLLVSTFLSFTFVSYRRRPGREAARQPADPADHDSQRSSCRTISTSSIPVRYGYWLKDVVTHKLGNSLLDAPADLARHHADARPHGAGDHHRGDPRDHPRRRRRHLLGDPPVLGLRLHLHVARASSASRCRRSGSRCCCRSCSSTST